MEKVVIEVVIGATLTRLYFRLLDSTWRVVNSLRFNRILRDSTDFDKGSTRVKNRRDVRWNG